jgi:branched-chain amino acid transport system substrate-binding protein
MHPRIARLTAVSAFAALLLYSALLPSRVRTAGRADHTTSSRKALPAIDLLGKEAEPSASPGEILIGVSNVQSGPSGALGRGLVHGSRAYFELVNARGGIYGRKITIVLKDDRYEPDPAVQNTNELIENDKVFFLFDYVGTPTLTRVLPLLKYYENEKIVNVAPFTGADPQRKPPYDKFVFNIRASYREETHALVHYLYAKGYRRVGFLGQADPYGKSGEIGVSDALAELNLKPVEVVSYRRNQSFETDMHAQVNLLRAAGADAVISVGVYGPCAAFIRDARTAGWNVPIANVSFVGAESMLEKLRDASKSAGKDLTANLINSDVVPSPADSHYPLVADYNAYLPGEPFRFSTLEGWLNAVVVTEALRRAGAAPSREDFIRAMESLHGWDPGLGIPLEFSPTSHQGLHRVWLTRTENGHWIPEEAPQETK